MSFTKSQLEFSVQLTENILKETARKYKRKFKVVNYQINGNRLWILSRDGEKVKTDPFPTMYNPCMNIVIYGGNNNYAIEVCMDKGFIRTSDFMGGWKIKDLNDFCLTEKLANIFYEKEWSPELCETIKDICREANKL